MDHCHGIGGYWSGMVDRGGLEVTIDERGVCCLFRGWSIGSQKQLQE